MNQLHISTQFDSGAIEVLSLDDPSDIRLNIRHDNASEFAQWFHFSLQGACGVPVHLRFLNAGNCAYPKGWEGYRVVASADRQATGRAERGPVEPPWAERCVDPLHWSRRTALHRVG